MFRTSDVDIANDATSNHFKGKNRYMEIQLQFKMKSISKDQLYLGFELDNFEERGIIQRSIVAASMKFMKKINPGLTYDYCGEEEQSDGRYIKPHIYLPLETCAHTFVRSRPGDTMPQLGTSLYEDEKVQKMRKKGKHCVAYNTEDTYTISCVTAQIDLIQWRALNVPFLRQFSLSRALGDQNFRMAFFSADPSLSQHRQCDVHKFASFKFGPRKKSRIGTSAKK